MHTRAGDDAAGPIRAALAGDAGAKAAKLVDFGRWCLRHMREPAPGDIDGGEAQDEAKRLGLLVEVEATEPCGENCACAEYHGEFPVTCLREADA
jgi:hypothetical protein